MGVHGSCSVSMGESLGTPDPCHSTCSKNILPALPAQPSKRKELPALPAQPSKRKETTVPSFRYSGSSHLYLYPWILKCYFLHENFEDHPTTGSHIRLLQSSVWCCLHLSFSHLLVVKHTHIQTTVTAEILAILLAALCSECYLIFNRGSTVC